VENPDVCIEVRLRLKDGANQQRIEREMCERIQDEFRYTALSIESMTVKIKQNK
jgi:hypothetical protein